MCAVCQENMLRFALTMAAVLVDVARSVLKSLSDYALSRHTRRNTVEVVSAPGLATLLDVALYRSAEGGLTATVCAADAALAAFLELKGRSSELLGLAVDGGSQRRRTGRDDQEGGGGGGSSSGKRRKGGVEGGGSVGIAAAHEDAEAFARVCLEVSNEAIRRLTTDKLALTANLHPDPQAGDDGAEGSASSGGAGGGGVGGSSHAGPSSAFGGEGSSENDAVVEGIILESSDSVLGRGRRSLLAPRRRDCWESPRLFCPDYVWADDAVSSCQKLVRGMAKHRFLSAGIAHSRLPVLSVGGSGGPGDGGGGGRVLVVPIPPGAQGREGHHGPRHGRSTGEAPSVPRRRRVRLGGL